MPYNTPELLLVGAAQNLVLASGPKTQTLQCWDLDTITYDPGPESDSNSW